MELFDAMNFARTNRWSVLTTVLEGAVELSPVATRPDDWDAYRAAMVTERRAVVRLAPDRAYGMLSLPRRGEAEEENP